MARQIDWKAQNESDTAFAKSTLLQLGSLQPMFIIHCNDKMNVIAAGWETQEQKRVQQALITTFAIAEGAIGISFIAEAWSRTVGRRHNETEAEHRARCEAVMPSQAEDRQEIVMVSTSYRDHDERRTYATVLEIIRDAAGKVTDAVVVGDPADDAARLEGPMASLLTHHQPSAYERERARMMFQELQKLVGLEMTTIPIGRMN